MKIFAEIKNLNYMPTHCYNCPLLKLKKRSNKCKITKEILNLDNIFKYRPDSCPLILETENDKEYEDMFAQYAKEIALRPELAEKRIRELRISMGCDPDSKEWIYTEGEEKNE